MAKPKPQRRGGIFGSFDVENSETPTSQENGFAKRAGGHRVARSGAHRSHGIHDTGSGYRGDVVLEDFIFEAKQTKNHSISIKVDWLNRMAIGARPKGKRPGLHIQFNGTTDIICDSKWVMIEESEFLELLNGKDKDQE